MDAPPRGDPPSSGGLPVQRSIYPPPNEAFLILFVALAATLTIGIALAKVGRSGIFLSELLFIIPPLIYLRIKKYPIRQIFRWNGVSIWVILATFLIGVALIILLDEVDRMMNMYFPMPAELQTSLNDFLKLDGWTDFMLVGFGVIFAAAICEESLFRGFLQSSLEANGSINRAVLFGALLFALAHFNPWWMVQILLLGVFLGFISWRANSTIPSMIIHGMNNGLALLSGGFDFDAKLKWYQWGKHVSPAVLIAAAALLFIGFKAFLRFSEETQIQETNNHGPSTS